MSLHKLDRTSVDNLLIRYAPRLSNVEIAGPGRAEHAYRLLVDGTERYAITLVHSSDYWRGRFHLARKNAPAVEMVVCWKHDTVAPVPCLALDESRYYEPHTAPESYTKRDRYSSMVIVGGLLCNLAVWHASIADMPVSTRYRYLDRMKEYTRRPRGRPLSA